MRLSFRVLVALLSCAALSACTTTLYGYQSSSEGSTATVTSASVAGSAKFSNARASFSSGPAVPANAPGGQVTLGNEATAVLVVGLLLADLFASIGEEATPAPKPLPAGANILHTCSCYGYQPSTTKERRTEDGEQ